MQNIFKLNQAAVNELADKFGTPLLVLSVEQVARNYEFLSEHLPNVKIHYAVKSNPNDHILETLDELGANFDVASDGEMMVLDAMGIAPERMVYANPVKTSGGLIAAARIGVHRFTFDSESEIYKMAEAIPGGTVLLRVRIDNPDALIDLNKKFGADPDDALRLLSIAREQGLDVAGLCFHVGSQCIGSAAYLHALAVCREIFDAANSKGFALHTLDIGGGFPIPDVAHDLDIATMLDEINAELIRLFPDTEIWSEPGRFICGTSVNLITRVIGKQVRNNQEWYFLDEGLYGSFSGVIFDHWDYQFETFKNGMKIAATFAGPSCDSMDILFRDKLTVPLEMGDLILVPACGAYTSASATVFNGFAKAPIIVWEDVQDDLQNQELLSAV